MKLRVERQRWGGVDEQAGSPPASDPHWIADAETGVRVCEREFADVVEATLYLVAMRPVLESRPLPPMSAEDEEYILSMWGNVRRMLERIDAGAQVDLRLPAFVHRALRQPHSQQLEAVVGPDRARLETLLRTG